MGAPTPLHTQGTWVLSLPRHTVLVAPHSWLQQLKVSRCQKQRDAQDPHSSPGGLWPQHTYCLKEGRGPSSVYGSASGGRGVQQAPQQGWCVRTALCGFTRPHPPSTGELVRGVSAAASGEESSCCSRYRQLWTVRMLKEVAELLKPRSTRVQAQRLDGQQLPGLSATTVPAAASCAAPSVSAFRGCTTEQPTPQLQIDLVSGLPSYYKLPN